MSDSTPWIASEAGPGDKKHAPATLRNRDAIAEVLADILPETGTVLEIASGSGEHAVHFARVFPDLQWQPSDASHDACRSIAAWSGEADLANLRQPIQLDVIATPWPMNAADAILCINLVHIAPWSAAQAVFGNAGRILPPGAPLVFYGPFIRNGVETAPSNLDFDASLRSRDPLWGLRSVEDMNGLAAASGFALSNILAMPANNLTLEYRRGSARAA